MNRSILIVICDFLLISLLVFSSVDIDKVANPGRDNRMQMTMVTNTPPEVVKDMTAVMRLALDDERKTQVQLRDDLSRARDEAARQQVRASQTEQQAQEIARRAKSLDEQLSSTEQKNTVLQTELQARTQQVRALDEKTQALDEQARAAEQKAVALQQELAARDRRVKELDEKTRASEQQVASLQTELQSREKQVQGFKEEIQSREEQALKLERDRQTLQQQFASAQTNIAALSQQVEAVRSEGSAAREKVALMEEQVRHQLEQSLALERQLAELSRSNQTVAVEKEKLSGQLQVAEAEKRMASGEVVRMQDQVKAEREERAKLSENIKVLAAKSGELAQEVRDGRTLAPNSIFNEFATNRVDTQILAVRAGVFGGESTKTRETQTVLVSDGTNIFALCHIQETPLTMWQPGVDWEGLSGTLSCRAVSLPIRSINFAAIDPRLILIPVAADDARKLGCRVYSACTDPYKFQDAVLVGAREGYYGQCSFQIDLSTPDYVKLDRNFIKGLFGKFNPSKGDFVFSRSGELLGVMANGTYCLMLRHFNSEATFKFGNEGRGQRTGTVLSALYAEVNGLPSKLQ